MGKPSFYNCSVSGGFCHGTYSLGGCVVIFGRAIFRLGRKTGRSGQYSPAQIDDFSLASSPMIEARNPRRLVYPDAVFLCAAPKKRGESDVRPVPKFRTNCA